MCIVDVVPVCMFVFEFVEYSLSVEFPRIFGSFCDAISTDSFEGLFHFFAVNIMRFELVGFVRFNGLLGIRMTH